MVRGIFPGISLAFVVIAPLLSWILCGFLELKEASIYFPLIFPFQFLAAKFEEIPLEPQSVLLLSQDGHQLQWAKKQCLAVLLDINLVPKELFSSWTTNRQEQSELQADCNITKPLASRHPFQPSWPSTVSLLDDPMLKRSYFLL